MYYLTKKLLFNNTISILTEPILKKTIEIFDKESDIIPTDFRIELLGEIFNHIVDACCIAPIVVRDILVLAVLKQIVGKCDGKNLIGKSVISQ